MQSRDGHEGAAAVPAHDRLHGGERRPDDPGGRLVHAAEGGRVAGVEQSVAARGALAHELEARIGDRLDIVLSEEGRRVDIAAAIAGLDPQGEFYVCGPIGMLEAAKRCWGASGRPADRLRFETFGSSGQYPTVPFTVRIPRLGKEILVPANQTMLEALEASGVEMIFDCRRGECGLCALPILAVDGVVDHRDVFFSDAEKAQNFKLCTCASRVYGASITVDTAER